MEPSSSKKPLCDQPSLATLRGFWEFRITKVRQAQKPCDKINDNDSNNDDDDYDNNDNDNDDEGDDDNFANLSVNYI